MRWPVLPINVKSSLLTRLEQLAGQRNFGTSLYDVREELLRALFALGVKQWRIDLPASFRTALLNRIVEDTRTLAEDPKPPSNESRKHVKKKQQQSQNDNGNVSIATSSTSSSSSLANPSRISAVKPSSVISFAAEENPGKSISACMQILFNMGAQCPDDFSAEEHRKIVGTVESYAMNGKLTPFAATKLLYWWGRLGLDYTTLQEREQNVVVMVLRCAVTPSIYASTIGASSVETIAASASSSSITHSYSASSSAVVKGKVNNNGKDTSAAMTSSSQDAALIPLTSTSSATNLNPPLPTTTGSPITTVPVSEGSSSTHTVGAAVEAMHLRDLFEALGGAVRMKLPMPGAYRCSNLSPNKI